MGITLQSPFTLPNKTNNFPVDANGVPAIGVEDNSGYITIPSSLWYKNASNLWAPVGEASPLPAQLTGSYATIDSAPAVGTKTVSTAAAEIFAGASRLANRYAMIVYNESSIPVYWGPAGVTTTTGFTLLPQDSIVFQFNPTVATPIYFIAGSSASVRVVELA